MLPESDFALVDIFPDTARRRIQNRRFFNPGVVIAHDQEDPRIRVPNLPAQSLEISHQEIIYKIPMREIQCLTAVPPMREKVTSDKHGLRPFSEDRLKKLLVSAYPAVKVGDKEIQGPSPTLNL
jgi:hypothetical protein